MLSNKEIVCPNKLLDIAHSKKGVKVAVVNAGKPPTHVVSSRCCK